MSLLFSQIWSVAKGEYCSMTMSSLHLQPSHGDGKTEIYFEPLEDLRNHDE